MNDFVCTTKSYFPYLLDFKGNKGNLRHGQTNEIHSNRNP
jgi:hypothetical protein